MLADPKFQRLYGREGENGGWRVMAQGVVGDWVSGGGGVADWTTTARRSPQAIIHKYLFLSPLDILHLLKKPISIQLISGCWGVLSQGFYGHWWYPRVVVSWILPGGVKRVYSSVKSGVLLRNSLEEQTSRWLIGQDGQWIWSDLTLKLCR